MAVVFGVLMLAVYIALGAAVAGGLFTVMFMPYALGAVIALLVDTQIPLVQHWIPGHPVMNYIAVLALVEIAIGILLHIRQTRKAVTVLCCSAFIWFVSVLILEELHADSVGYCIFVSVVYTAIASFCIMLNLRSVPLNRQSGNLLCIILSGCMYGISAALLLSAPLDSVWKNYLVAAGVTEGRFDQFLDLACGIAAITAVVLTVYRNRKACG